MPRYKIEVVFETKMEHIANDIQIAIECFLLDREKMNYIGNDYCVSEPEEI